MSQKCISQLYIVANLLQPSCNYINAQPYKVRYRSMSNFIRIHTGHSRKVILYSTSQLCDNIGNIIVYAYYCSGLRC